jgi:hypothetical protein
MKNFREFLSEDAVKAQQAWEDWMKQNPKEFSRGGRFYERRSSAKTTTAAKDFMKTYMKTGKPPAGFEVKSTKVSGQDVRGTSQTSPKGTQTRTQTPSRGAQTGTQTPPKGTQASSGSTPPPRNTQASSAPPRSSGGLSTAAKPPTAAPKKPGLSGRIANAGYAAYDVYDRTKTRMNKGENLPSAATKSAAEAGGGWAGSVGAIKAAAPLTAKLRNPLAIGAANLAIGAAGYSAGSKGAEGIVKKLENPLGGPTDKDVEKATQKYGMRKSRQVAAKSNVYGAKQGSALTGIGGKTTTSKDAKGNAFMSTGAGKQRQTVQLAKTQLVRDPKTGQQRVGDLAFKGGKATYLARPSTASRDSNASPGGTWRNIQRSLNIGGQRERDAAASKQEYRTALKNTQTYQKKLGITPKAATAQKLPGRGVGPAKVGPKLVGPKIVGPKKVGTGAPKPQSPAKSLIKPA